MKNPYTVLKEGVLKFIGQIKFPTQVFLWRYAKEELSDGWNLENIFERTAAANALGYRVEIRAVVSGDKKGLEVWYVKNPDYNVLPWQIRP